MQIYIHPSPAPIRTFSLLIIFFPNQIPYFPCLCLCFGFSEQMIYTVPGPFFPPFLLTDLHPSQSFFTELLVFIPRICSPITFSDPANVIGRLKALSAVWKVDVDIARCWMQAMEFEVGAFEGNGRRRERAVRHRELRDDMV